MKKQLVLSLGSVLLLLVASSEAWSAERRMFVTSTTGTGDLGSWPGARFNTGVAAGDTVCQSLAHTADFANPDNFIAWISDSSDDAYCRLHGLTGTKADDCGEISLPRAAGPWLRADGSPFAPRIGGMLGISGQLFHPPRLDETGSTVADRLATGTDPLGVFASTTGNCQDWTSQGSDLTAIGSTERTTAGWTQAGGTSCFAEFRLLCMERLPGPSLPAFAETGRKAFVTSITGVGDLGTWSDAGGHSGIAAGDTICRARAGAEGLTYPSSFKAWLSTSSVDAKDRFVFDGPWMRLDGIRIADGIADLTDDVLHSSLNVTELRDYLPNSGVWTGTDSSGLGYSDTCDDWLTSSAAESGYKGSANAADSAWTANITSGCDASWLHLYCFSDIDPAILFIFSDGFELGDLSAWSASTP